MLHPTPEVHTGFLDIPLQKKFIGATHSHRVCLCNGCWERRRGMLMGAVRDFFDSEHVCVPGRFFDLERDAAWIEELLMVYRQCVSSNFYLATKAEFVSMLTGSETPVVDAQKARKRD